jgi:hypothetical protein
VQEEQKKLEGLCHKVASASKDGEKPEKGRKALAIKDQALANRRKSLFLGRRDREGIDCGSHHSNSGSRCWNVQEGACFEQLHLFLIPLSATFL